MKIIHEKYKNTRKVEDAFVTEFKNSFQEASETNKELAGLIGKTQELLNPLKVLQLFENISDEVRILLYFFDYTVCFLNTDDFERFMFSKCETY